ncbi:MAG: GLPGLI family protein [Bacteroidetes bacterium]|nr:GLPGLI family protein [Bacteroidota bacterium]
MTKAFALLFFVLVWGLVPAKAQFTTQGHIEYQRRCNLHKLWAGDKWMERMTDKINPIMITYSNLDFNQELSRYSPGQEGVVPKMYWGLPPGADNEVVQDFQSGRLWAYKNFYDKKFYISDTLPRLKWRIEKEVRDIAGYSCRKAVTRICDSVYVVAFYTEAIPVPGGPEQMGGLPGMILELAVPRLYTTWIATKVEQGTKPKPEPADTSRKTISRSELEKSLSKSLEDWGKNARRNIWWAIL